MPICALINHRIFCVASGLSPELSLGLKKSNATDMGGSFAGFLELAPRFRVKKHRSQFGVSPTNDTHEANRQLGLTIGGQVSFPLHMISRLRVLSCIMRGLPADLGVKNTCPIPISTGPFSPRSLVEKQDSYRRPSVRHSPDVMQASRPGEWRRPVEQDELDSRPSGSRNLFRCFLVVGFTEQVSLADRGSGWPNREIRG